MFRVLNSSLPTDKLFGFIVLLTSTMIITLSMSPNLKDFLNVIYSNISSFYYPLPGESCRELLFNDAVNCRMYIASAMGVWNRSRDHCCSDTDSRNIPVAVLLCPPQLWHGYTVTVTVTVCERLQLCALARLALSCHHLHCWSKQTAKCDGRGTYHTVVAYVTWSHDTGHMWLYYGHVDQVDAVSQATERDVEFPGEQHVEKTCNFIDLLTLVHEIYLIYFSWIILSLYLLYYQLTALNLRLQSFLLCPIIVIFVVLFTDRLQ